MMSTGRIILSTSEKQFRLDNNLPEKRGNFFPYTDPYLENFLAKLYPIKKGDIIFEEGNEFGIIKKGD